MGVSAGKNPVIQVKMFGGFSMSMEGKTLSDEENRSRKAWSLLCYLIVNRGKDIGVSELYQSIWQEDLEENPYGALKTLVFRVRRMLDAAGFPSTKLILSQKGIYKWNPDWELAVDTDEFEALCSQCLEPGADIEDAQALWRRAMELYTGEFLPDYTEESWAGSLNRRYQSRYRKLVCRVVRGLLEKKRGQEAVQICEQAAVLDDFCEDFHYYHILALHQLGRQKEALSQYKEVTERFYRERLMTPSEHFKELYQIICSSCQEEIETLEQIKERLEQTMEDNVQEDGGAYECEYAVFKRLFQLERRGVERSGGSVYLCLLTMGDRFGRPLKPDIQLRAMERLRSSIKSSLRASDMFARYSVSQYTVLLPSTTYESGERVMRRIVTAFNKAYVRKDVLAVYSLSQVMPLD